jgi:hypothetical protein
VRAEEGKKGTEKGKKKKGILQQKEEIHKKERAEDGKRSRERKDRKEV